MESEHYNAKGLSAESLADSFVPSRQYFTSVLCSSTVIVGPRGSGKTTLLRMLDPRVIRRRGAVSDESHPDQGRPSFVGVFVPIDAVWVSSLENTLSRSQEPASSVHLTVYSLAAMRAFVDVLQWRCSPDSRGGDFHIALEAVEKSLAKELGETWFPGARIRTLLELRLHIARELSALPDRWISADAAVRDSLTGPFRNPVERIAVACEIVNLIVSEPNRVWALLCDELEIAPPAVQSLLFKSLRAIPRNLLLKLAFTPRRKIEFGDEDDLPLPANDYEFVSLSYPSREESPTERERERFCVELWSSLVRRSGRSFSVNATDPYAAIESPGKRIGRGVAPRDVLEERFGDLFRRLAEKDASFRAYLEEKAVRIDNLDENSQETKDQVIRKVRPIVEVRDFFLKSSAKGGMVRASRKASTVYCGASRIFAMSEGHPRWLKYTLSSMLAKASDTPPIVPLSLQHAEIQRAVQRVEARLRALTSPGISVEAMIDRIGYFFRAQVLSSTFKSDPYLSFFIDENVRTDELRCIEQALYVGAIVPMQVDMLDLFTKGVEGRRFRLSHWLAPKFGLPLISGKPVKLSTMRSPGAAERVAEDAVQTNLGFEK